MFAKGLKTKIPKSKLNSIKFKKSICDPNNILSCTCRACNSECNVYLFITSTHNSRVIGKMFTNSQRTEFSKSKFNSINEYDKKCKIM